MSAIPYADIDADQRRRVGRLLAVWAAMVLVIVVIGGVTRLTESGLSITEWAPVTGIIPPLSQQTWGEAFEAYQRIPQYQQLNRGMTLDEFKTIYFWNTCTDSGPALSGSSSRSSSCTSWFEAGCPNS